MSKYDNSMPMEHEAVMSWQAGEIARLKALLAMAGRNGLELLNDIDRLKALVAQCREALEQWVKCCETSKTIRTEVAVPLRTLAAIEKDL